MKTLMVPVINDGRVEETKFVSLPDLLELIEGEAAGYDDPMCDPSTLAGGTAIRDLAATIRKETQSND